MKGIVILLASVLFLGGRPAGAEEAGQEPKEITIRLSGNKQVGAALLDAVDKGKSVTGIADFDSLSIIYGLMGIYREGMSSGFYGHRFRLRFPPDVDVVVITGAYKNLPYITGGGGTVGAQKRSRGWKKTCVRYAWRYCLWARRSVNLIPRPNRRRWYRGSYRARLGFLGRQRSWKRNWR